MNFGSQLRLFLISVLGDVVYNLYFTLLLHIITNSDENQNALYYYRFLIGFDTWNMALYMSVFSTQYTI